MSLNDFLTLVTQALYLLVAGVTLLEWVRHREQTQLDITLVFVSLAITIIVQDVQRVAGLQLPWLSSLGSLATLAQPYLLLRVAQYFRPVRPLIRRGALLGLGLSWLALVSASVFNLSPLPTSITLLIIVYFVGVEAYATLIFVRGALTSTGITRRRLGLASAGSGLLAAIILFAGVAVVLPASLGPFITPVFQVLAALSGLSYYLGFATPRWLKQVWQHSELYRFMYQSATQAAPDRSAMFEKLRSAAIRAVGGLTTVTARWEPAEQHLRLDTLGEPSLPAMPLEAEAGAIGRAWREQQARVAGVPEDLGAESAQWAEQIGARALLIMPIISPSRAWGLLIVALGQRPLFAQDDLDVLHLLARETALTLDYAALIEELQVVNQSLEERVAERTADLARTNRALRTLSECNQIMVRAAGELELLQKICQTTVESGGYRLAWVGFAEQDEAKTVRPVAQAGYEAGYLETLSLTWADTEPGRGATGTAIRTGQPVVIQNILTYAPWRDEAIHRGYHSTIALPLMTDSQPQGVLRLYAAEPGAFDDEEVKLLTELANDVAYGITALRLRAEHARAEEQLRQSAARAETLAELSRALAAVTTDYQAVLDTTARRIAELIGGTCNIRLVSEDGQWADVAAAYHPSPEVAASFREMLTATPQRADEGLIGQVIQTGQPRLMPVISAEQLKATTHPKFWPLLEIVGIYSLLIVPLRAQGRVLGALAVSRDQPGHPYTADDQAFLQDLGDRAALVISNARLYEGTQRLNVELEQRVTDRTAQLEATNRELQQAKSEADRANQAKSEFLSRMSHELRTPLNAILGFAQILDMEVISPEQQEGVKHILTGGRHLLNLINEVLDIARIETGRLSFSPEPIQASEVLQETLDLIEPLATQRNIRLHLAEIPDRHIRADHQRFKQVLLNLMSNAVKYNREGGRVTVTCAAPEAVPAERLRLVISDTGPGIPADKLGRLFTPFDRLDADETLVPGTGLGLALSKSLVEAMGGAIGVESVAGQGSTFWVEMPIAEAPVERLKRTGNLGLPAAPASAKAKTVLYVEDNLSNLRLVEQILAHRPAIRLLSAMQGQLCLDLAREHQPDLILLDLNLPDLHGSQVLNLLQADSRTEAIPVVVISADATTHQIERLLAAGARTYLTKPLDVKQFLRVMDKLLE